MGVQGFTEIPADVVAAQIKAVASDMGVDAAKTGMLATAEIIRAVAKTLDEDRRCSTSRWWSTRWRRR